MTITFSKRIQPIQNNDMENFIELAHLPDKCPVCQKGISPEFILIYSRTDYHKELVCLCPLRNCQSLFTAYYNLPTSSYVSGNNKLKIWKYAPQTTIKMEFPKDISELSPNFVEIYNQALQAEQNDLNLICGVGYRKALEFLIKDYAKKSSDEEEQTRINSMPLQKCVKEFITEPSIKDMAERAIWLGNDETHYERKWEDKDINDLKSLIDITVYFLSMKIKAEKYMIDMESGKR